MLKRIPTEMNKLAKVFQNFRVNIISITIFSAIILIGPIDVLLIYVHIFTYNVHLLRDVSCYGTTTYKRVCIGVLVVLNTESRWGHHSAKFACLILCYCKDLKVNCVSIVCAMTLLDFPTYCFPIINIFSL